MSGSLLKNRELYIDVSVKENQTEEIFLYQVDFFRDASFRTREFVYKREEVKEQQDAEGQESPEAEELPPQPEEMFKEQWDIFCEKDVPTQVYATDAMSVMEYVLEPLAKQFPDFKMMPSRMSGREFLHDCVSMGRVVSMSAFDEEQYLSAGIRRRMKERYHDYVDEIKTERKEHMFIKQTMSEDMPVLLLTITDEKYKTKKQVMLNRGMKEETMAVRFREILSLYPDADVILDTTTPELYRLFRNMNQFMGMENRRLVFSLESMLSALGKSTEIKDMVKTYLLYVKNQEEMRLGTFLPEHLCSVHSFYLPVQLSKEKAWKKQFEKNTVWKKEGTDVVSIVAEGDFKGKYVVKSGKEQFILKLRKISLERYMKKYAVLRLELENYCYPGKEDKARINALAEELFTGENTDVMELKLKNGKQAYSLTAIPMEGNESQLWLNGLLELGRKKKRNKKALVLSALKARMYCVENQETAKEDSIIQYAVVKDGILRKIEDAMANAMKPERDICPTGQLLKRQKKAIKELFELYRYVVVSFTEHCEATQDRKQKTLWQTTEKSLETAELKERLDKKFGLFF